MKITPQMFEIPHAEFRKHQLPTIKFIVQNQGKTLIIEAPTGSGKSAIGSALGSIDSVRILTRTKSLQVQYESYKAEVLFGLSNYPCAKFADTLWGTVYADACPFVNMYNCDYSDECAYLKKRKRTQKSNRQALSYAYFLNAAWTKGQDVAFLYCDEAHILPHLIMQYAEFEIGLADLDTYDLIKWPEKERLLSSWLSNCGVDLEMQIDEMADAAINNLKIARRMQKFRKKHQQIESVASLLLQNPDAFYIENERDKLKILPLTAKFWFNDLFGDDVILTSATIGNPQAFADVLGISSFSPYTIPSEFSANDTPVHVFRGAPRMNYRSSEAERDKQAEIIKKMVGMCPPEWNGLIHVSSKKQAFDLCERLARKGLQDRLWIPKIAGTNEKVQAWKTRLKKVTNTLCVTWAFHEGVDAPFCNINIVAKVPYQLLDAIGRKRMEYDRDLYPWTAAVNTMQAAGRIRRGEPNHYGPAAEKFVGVADGNVWSLQDFYSSHFNQCLTYL